MLFFTVTSRLLQGFGLTCAIFGITLLCALPLGLVVAFCSMSKFNPLRYLSKTFVWVIRSTPLMLQVIIVFYGPGLLWQATAMPRINAVVIAFIINYAAYFSEIYRGGIESISHGQYEAGQVLGMTKSQIFFKVILLQVVKRIVPPMSNEIITLVKDTSLARIIAVKEIIMVAQEYIATYALIWPLFYSGVFYLVFCGLLTLLFGRVERKLGYFKV
ncbi:MAG: amino acid ABC transporter permease [Christensenellaceae bacterium]|jgi:polar amino acid transport system permease protein|nr:amino acid ABC transporter permease [Christensenellaceae bacterium]